MILNQLFLHYSNQLSRHSFKRVPTSIKGENANCKGDPAGVPYEKLKVQVRSALEARTH